jgi:hypothetical protein
MFALVFGGKFPLDPRRGSLWLGHGGNQHHQNQADKLAKDFEMGVGWHGIGGHETQSSSLSCSKITIQIVEQADNWDKSCLRFSK